MSSAGTLKRMFVLGLLLLLAGPAGEAVAADLVRDGTFEACKSSKSLRRDGKGPDWYESRRDGKGHGLLMLSTKDVGGNKTKKAMIKADPELNTYLSHRFAKAQNVFLRVQYDIFVREILPDDNRSAFCFVGGIRDKKGGPNSTGPERFVFLGFENAAEKGKVNLFAREGQSSWAERTIVAKGLDLGKWYTVTLQLNIPEGVYEVAVKGVQEPFELEAFFTKGKTPQMLTHLSFASWNDGAGTFYVDNVVVRDD